MKTAEERRLAKRITFKEPVRYELLDPGHFAGTVAYDISESGLRLRLPEFLPLGTEVVLNIALRPGQNVDCRGRIVWVSQIPYSDQYQAGVTFADPEIIPEEKKRSAAWWPLPFRPPPEN